MSRTRVIVVTIGVMMSLFLAAMESTVVATAMPTIASQLGGLSSYSWVFAAYMLTSTTVVPVFGKLADVYGIRSMYLVAIAIFLVGSVLCGRAATMTELIAFRAVQGIGAGGVMPLAFTTVGAIFSLQERARMQGWFSGVWGVSSVFGPLLGGFLVDQVSWRWVFYVNIVPGLLAAALVWGALQEPEHEKGARPAVDYAGVVLLSAAIVLLLLGLFELGTTTSWLLLGGAVLSGAVLAWVEQRAADPIVPLRLFGTRSFAVASGHGLLAGFAMFGSVSFVPLFAQAVFGTSATGAGATLTPLMLGWVLASIVGSRLLLRYAYRTIALTGMVMLTLGAGLMLLPFMSALGVPGLLVPTGLMGVGMGLSIPAFLIAVQSSVARRDLGTATSTIQFTRSIGGTLGVSVMGVALASGLASALRAAGIDPASVSLDGLIDHASEGGAAVDGVLRDALAHAMTGVFWLAFGAAALGLLVTILAPRGRIGQPEDIGAPAAEPAGMAEVEGRAATETP